jgi:hypothetical protein
MSKKATAVEFKVESNVAVPAVAPFRTGRKSKYPFATMKPGQSFEAPASERQRLSGAAQNAKKRYGYGFKVLRMSETTVRVWCVVPKDKASKKKRSKAK